ncbi:MAG: HPr family phosphocarrier protein [Planctomycetota bacterium]|nr:MAG: HPr family phosphocarrier protein [Planctomycetota bacterium]
MEIVKQLKLENEEGLHARPAVKLVDTANRFECDVTIEADGREVNGKSMMSVLTLAAAKGTVLNFITRGADAREAMDAIEALIVSKFGEE